MIWAFRVAVATLLWLAGLAMAFLAGNATDPFFSPVPFAAWIALLAGSAVIVATILYVRTWKHSISGGGLLALWSAVFLMLCFTQLKLAWQEQGILAASPEEIAALGPHFIIGYQDAGEIDALSARGLIGGIYLTKRNIAGRRAEDLRDEIARLQALRERAGLPRLIVATDQEGGIVSHLSPPLTHFPALSALAELPADQRDAAARAQGVAQGKELADIGVTLDFAPVVDLLRLHRANPLDFQSHIGKRAISGDPAVTSAVARAFVDGLRQSHVGATLKHFPGLGGVPADTHYFSARLDTPRDELEASDWRPFRDILGRTDAVMMVGHVVVASVDPDTPASHSKKVIDGVVRQGWGYRGLIVTDDMVMGAVYGHGFCKAVIESLDAGIDLVLIAYDGRQYYPAMSCALAAWRSGTLDRNAIEASRARLVRAGGG